MLLIDASQEPDSRNFTCKVELYSTHPFICSRRHYLTTVFQALNSIELSKDVLIDRRINTPRCYRHPNIMKTSLWNIPEKTGNWGDKGHYTRTRKPRNLHTILAQLLHRIYLRSYSIRTVFSPLETRRFWKNQIEGGNEREWASFHIPDVKAAKGKQSHESSHISGLANHQRIHWGNPVPLGPCLVTCIVGFANSLYAEQCLPHALCVTELIYVGSSLEDLMWKL